MEPTLLEILDARERRAVRQRKLTAATHCPLVSFTMNIAGPVKYSPAIDRGFAVGLSRLEGMLTGLTVLSRNVIRENTGCEALFAVDADPLFLKALAVHLEDQDGFGRLLDIDILDAKGNKLDRQLLGLSPRKCLLCEKDARLCSRSRTHSVAQLQEKTAELLDSVSDVPPLSMLAVKALLWEVFTTPKPGLVDRNNSGSHKDMALLTFVSSVYALAPYFGEAVRIGRQTQHLSPQETFAALRQPGIRAEQEMLRATGGVNTHKGAIFTLGILCGALGRLNAPFGAEEILALCGEMTAGITREFDSTTQETAGTRLYRNYGITGIRGQAEKGFPAVLQVGLPRLEQGLSQGLSLNDAGCAALLWLMTAIEDTNLITRGGYDRWKTLLSETQAVLETTPFPDKTCLEQLDAAFIRENLSPGGSADLLAMTYFLHFLNKLTV